MANQRDKLVGPAFFDLKPHEVLLLGGNVVPVLVKVVMLGLRNQGFWCPT
jgi:hypothetical protein